MENEVVKNEVVKKTTLVVAISFLLTILIFALDSLYTYGLGEFLINLMK